MYRSIETAMWDDPWFAELPPNAKLLFIYLITNRRATACGVFEIQRRALTFETGLSGDAVKEAIEALHEKVTWWGGHQIIWVHNFYRRQRANTGPSFTVSAQKALATFPPDVQETVAALYPELASAPNDPNPRPPNGKATHPLPTPHPNGRHVTPSPVAVDTHGTSVTVSVTGAEEVTEAGERVGSAVAHVADAPPIDTPPRPARKPPSKKPKTPIPDPFEVTPAMAEWALTQGMASNFIRDGTEYFVRWAEMHDHRYVDWEAAWRNVMQSRWDEQGAKVVPIRRAQ